MANGKFRAVLPEFLRNGTLGPIAIGVPMRLVGECLGPPKYWTFRDAGVPFFWGYDGLELIFSDRRPHRVEWLKLSNAERLSGTSVALCRGMRMRLEGLDGRMRPSEILRRSSHLRDEADVTIQMIAGELQLRIGRYPVQLLYSLHGDESLDANGLAAFEAGDWQYISAPLDEKVTLHSIAAFSRSGWKDRHWRTPILKVSAKSYLDLIGETPSSDS